MDKYTEIRPIALGLAIKNNKLLVEEKFDKIKNQTFYRCLGGGIEFLEKSSDALKREFKEEVNIDITVKVHPSTVFPNRWTISEYIIIIMLMKNITIPNIKIILIGFTLNEVIPSNAKDNIFFNGYLLFPAYLSFLSYVTMLDLNPINGTIPLKNKLTSSKFSSASSALLLISL